jgi:hypothetical protein
MPNLTRKKVRREVGSLDVSWTTLKDLRDQIDGYIKQYGENAEVDKTTVAYDDYEYVAVFSLVDEDDHQYSQRIAQETMIELAQVDHEKAEFKRLSEKYGKPNWI